MTKQRVNGMVGGTVLLHTSTTILLHTITTLLQNLKVMTKQRVNGMVGGDCGIERARLISSAEERLDAEFVGKLRFGRTPDRGRFLEPFALQNRVSIQVCMFTCGASV